MPKPEKTHYYPGHGKTTLCRRKLHNKLKYSEFYKEVNCFQCVRLLGAAARLGVRDEDL